MARTCPRARLAFVFLRSDQRFPEYAMDRSADRDAGGRTPGGCCTAYTTACVHVVRLTLVNGDLTIAFMSDN